MLALLDYPTNGAPKPSSLSTLILKPRLSLSLAAPLDLDRSLLDTARYDSQEVSLGPVGPQDASQYIHQVHLAGLGLAQRYDLAAHLRSGIFELP